LLQAARIASELRDAELASQAALANSRGYASVVGERDEERLAAIARALELDEPPHPAQRAQLLALQAMELSWDPDLSRRKALADESLALARGANDSGTLAAVLQRAFYGLWSPETLAVRLSLAAEFADCAATLGDPALAFWAQQVSVHSFIEHGKLAEARQAAERGWALADQLGQPALLWFDRFVRAGLELVHGDLGAGEPLAEEALQLGQEAGQPDALLTYAGQITFIRAYQGRQDEVIDMIRQGASAFPGVPGFRAGLAGALCSLDRHDEARAIVDQAASDRFEHLGSTLGTLTALALYADAAFVLSDARAAAILYERLEPFGEQVVWSGASGYGHVRMYLGLLAAAIGDDQRADEHLQFACEFHEANDIPVWAARGQLGWAESLVARGDAPAARDHAARALELSREYGYGESERRAAALLAAQAAADA
jgi:hypothetical protein